MVRRWLLALCIAGGLGLPAAAETPPQRVLSMNLCTDQLAMMLAGPGQLISVSFLARDERASVMAEQAKAYPVNHASAEQIFLNRPDLVLASSHSPPATVQMLQRLGIRVEVFPPENSMADIRANLLRMGTVLGREDRAQAIIARFDAELAQAALPAAGPRPVAATYAANGYSAGTTSLSGEVIRMAGFDNLADILGMSAGGNIPLEVLVMASPDLVITSEPYPGASRSEEVLNHPALSALKARATAQIVSDRDWICGTPYVLDSVARLRAIREAM